MRYGVLGRLYIEHDGAEIVVPGSRPQAVLVALVLGRGRAVSPDTLVDALWEDDPPPGAAAALQSYVSRLRRVLGRDAVLLVPGGYRLVAGPDDVDVMRFERLAAEGAARDDDPDGAERLLREALELWRGPALEGFSTLPFTSHEAVRLEEARLVVEERLCEVLLRRGTPPEVLDRLGRLVAAHPLREEARRLHALALYRSGRQADALAALAAGRRRLREELGLDPGRPLQELEQQMLLQDPALDAAPTRDSTGSTAPAAAAPPPILSPVLVGRDTESQLLREALERAARGHGSTVVVLAPAGAGKSRLVRDVLGGAGAVLSGRAVSGPVPVPFRPLAEAVQAGLRHHTVLPDLGPYRTVLGRLVPEWHDQDAPLSPLTHLAEGMLRLLRGLAGDRPLAVVMEDLHWADDETLAVLEYLADNVGSDRLLLVLTARTEEGPATLRLVHELEVRRSATVLRLAPLTAGEVASMVSACLGRPPSDQLVGDLVTRSAGIPLYVEELLAAAEAPERAVPATFAQAVRSRTGALRPVQLRVLRAAAVLGRRFDWRLLPAVTALPETEVLAALRAASDLQVLQGSGDALQFRHALHRDAILGDVFPPERSAMAAAALAVLRARSPGLPGDACQLAADLAEQSGAAEDAARLLVEAARRAADHGALGTAELLLDRALRLAPLESGTAALELLLEVLTQAVRGDRVPEVGEQLLAILDREGDRRRAAGVLVRLAEASAAAARYAPAREYLARARPQLGDDERVALRADLVAAECDVAQSLPSAEEQAADVAARAAALGEPALEEQALLLVGRCQRDHDLDAAEQTFGRVRARALADGAPLRAVRALAELGSVDLLRGAPIDRLVHAAEAAEQLGAVGIAGVARLHAAVTSAVRGDRAGGLPQAREARRIAERYHLAIVGPGALIVEASLHGLVGDTGAVEAALELAEPLIRESPEWEARAWGISRAVGLIAVERRAEALAALRHARATLVDLPFDASPLHGLSALVEAVETGTEVYPDSRADRWTIPATRGLVLAAAAVLAGQRRNRDSAEETYAQARSVLATLPWFQHVGARLVGERALSDGWGQPEKWLTEAAAWLESYGLDAVAAACRTLLLRRPVSPRHLPGVVLTPREQEVLDLVATGASNREIAQRLAVSPRTVEKHVERLLQKTATNSRTALAVLAASAYAVPRT